MQVLEDDETRHEARRQRRPARIVVVDLTEAALEKAPVDTGSELHQRMLQIDDLVEPGLEQIRLAGPLPLFGSHESPRREVDREASNHAQKR